MVKIDKLMKRRNKKKFSKRKIVRKVSKKNTFQEKESKIKLINVIRTSSGLEKDIKKIDKKIEMDNFPDFLLSISPNHIASNLEQIAPLENIRTTFLREFDKNENSEGNYEIGGRENYTENQKYVSPEDRKYSEFDSQRNVDRINRNIVNDSIFKNPEKINQSENYKNSQNKGYQTNLKDTRVSHRQKLPWKED